MMGRMWLERPDEEGWYFWRRCRSHGSDSFYWHVYYVERLTNGYTFWQDGVTAHRPTSGAWSKINE